TGQEFGVGQHGGVVPQPRPDLGTAALAESEADDGLAAEADVDRVQDRDGQEQHEAHSGGRDEGVGEAVAALGQGGRSGGHDRTYPWFSRSATVPSWRVVIASVNARADPDWVARPKASLNSE